MESSSGYEASTSTFFCARNSPELLLHIFCSSSTLRLLSISSSPFISSSFPSYSQNPNSNANSWWGIEGECCRVATCGESGMIVWGSLDFQIRGVGLGWFVA
ncbi:hypothetical protein Droror1_Dr00010568 [Drosera rotundifolia]